MFEIKTLSAREILDSRGFPTIEVDCHFSSGAFGRAAVPSGASTGSREALELRDNDDKRYCGKGVLQAVNNVNATISQSICGQSFVDIHSLDKALIALDGTDNKSALGANAILGVSMAFACAIANQSQRSLYDVLHDAYHQQNGASALQMPVPMMNVINGGAHANNLLDIQEFMIIPVGASSFSESLRYGAEVFHALKSLLAKQSYLTAVGDEGGFAPNLKSHREALELLMESIELAGFRPKTDIALALDVASTEFYQDDHYMLTKQGKRFTSDEMIEYIRALIEDYPIISVEDPMAEDDWSGWAKLTRELGNQVQIVGDDLFVTNCKYLQRGIEEQASNSILIKLNQVGSVSETLNAIAMASDNRFNVVVSHRSGETEDTFIADLAVATGCGQIKTGSLSRSDRIAKYNQLLRIEAQLGSRARFEPDKVFQAFLT